LFTDFNRLLGRIVFLEFSDHSLSQIVKIVHASLITKMNIFLWVLFFALNIYGQIAMKQATNGVSAAGLAYFWDLAKNFWAVTAVMAWTGSSFLWMVLLKKQPLMEAQSISALNYAFIALAAVAFLGESVSGYKLAGIALIALGIYLVVR